MEPDEKAPAGAQSKSEGAMVTEKPVADGSAADAPPPSSEGASQEAAAGQTAVAAALKVADTEPPTAPDGVAPAPSVANVHGKQWLVSASVDGCHHGRSACSHALEITASVVIPAPSIKPVHGADAVAEVGNGEVKGEDQKTATAAAPSAAETVTQPEKADTAGAHSGAAGDEKRASETKDDGNKEHAKPAEKRKRQYHVDTDLLRAFRYFDKTGALQDEVSSGQSPWSFDALRVMPCRLRPPTCSACSLIVIHAEARFARHVSKRSARRSS